MRRMSTALSRRLSASRARASAGLARSSVRKPGVSVRLASGLSGEPPGGDCPRCSDELGVETCVTACGHRFCRSCVEKMLRDPSRKSECQTCGKPLSYYSVQWLDLRTPVKDKDVASIIGTAFIQFGSIGLESFHFDQGGCYLKYDAKVIPKKWRLDNGDRLPLKKPFESGWTYDPVQRIFKGTVDWGERAFRGVKKLKYEMHFDEGLELVESGKVVMYRTDGWWRTRHFGGDKLKNLHYRRAKTTIYGNSYVRVPSPEESEMADKIVKSLGSLGSWGMGINPEAVETMLWNELPLMHVGVFSLHFGKERSFVDVSEVEGYHPSRFYFENYKFFPETRTFKGEVVGESEYDLLAGRTQWILHFDETLDRIVWGKIKYFDDNDRLVREELCGWTDSKSQRYLLVAPWQVLDDPESSNRFGALEDLL